MIVSDHDSHKKLTPVQSLASPADQRKKSQSWVKTADSFTKRLNLAWWLHTLSLPLIFFSLCGACAILVLRHELSTFPWSETLFATMIIILAIGITTWLIARRHFTSRKKTLVRLEASMGLNNTLSAANQGLSPWPDAPESLPLKSTDGTYWNWPRLIIPPLACLAILSLSFLIPISAKSSQDTDPPEEPRSWKDIESSLDALEHNKAVEDDYIEKTKKQIEELRQQDAQDWFSHSSLEASDELKKTHSNAMQELRRNMKRAEKSLNTLSKKSTSLTPAQKDRLMNDLDSALQQIEQGKLKPNKELLNQLGKIDPQNLNQLSPEQLQQIRQNMREHSQQMQEAQQQMGGNQAQDWEDELNSEGPQNSGDG